MTTYKQLRNNGMTAIEAFNRAKAGGVWADVKPRYIYPDYNSSGWIENVFAALRFYKFADKINERIRHQGWFTSEDGDNGEVLRGAVYRLPHNRYVAGYADPNNPDCARIDFSSVYYDEGEAAYAANRFAESEAKKEREYNSAWQAGAGYVAAGEEISSTRKKTLQLIKEVKQMARYGTPAICEALQHSVQRSILVINELRTRRNELLSEWGNNEAFKEAA